MSYIGGKASKKDEETRAKFAELFAKRKLEDTKAKKKEKSAADASPGTSSATPDPSVFAAALNKPSKIPVARASTSSTPPARVAAPLPPPPAPVERAPPSLAYQMTRTANHGQILHNMHRIAENIADAHPHYGRELTDTEIRAEDMISYRTGEKFRLPGDPVSQEEREGRRSLSIGDTKWVGDFVKKRLYDKKLWNNINYHSEAISEYKAGESKTAPAAGRPLYVITIDIHFGRYTYEINTSMHITKSGASSEASARLQRDTAQKLVHRNEYASRVKSDIYRVGWEIRQATHNAVPSPATSLANAIAEAMSTTKSPFPYAVAVYPKTSSVLAPIASFEEEMNIFFKTSVAVDDRVIIVLQGNTYAPINDLAPYPSIEEFKINHPDMYARIRNEIINP
jgi:hypothetical protein